MSKVIDTSCEGWGDMTAGFQLNVPAVLGIVQAMQYALDHKEDFLKIYDCERCYETVKNMHALFTDVFKKAEEQKQLIMLQQSSKKLSV